MVYNFIGGKKWKNTNATFAVMNMTLQKEIRITEYLQEHLLINCPKIGYALFAK